MTPATLIRDSRKSAGLTQQQLADRLGVDQSVVARLERAASDPRFSTLTDALAAAGFTVEVRVHRRDDGIDESQIEERLRLTPAERLAAFQASQRSLSDLVRGARRV